MSGRGSRDSGMKTTRISFLAFHSFLNRSILAAASSLMDDPRLWVGHVTSRQKQVWKTPKRTSQTTSRCTALAARTPAPVRWAPQLWLLTLVSKSWLRRVRLWCHALHPRAQSALSSTFCRPSCSSLGDLMPTVTSGEAADNFMSREGIC